MRPDVVGGRQVERLRPGLAHQPRDQRVDLLRRHGAGAEDQRVGLLPLVLLGVDVERLALDDDRLLDRLPRRAVDAAEDDVDLVVLDELPALAAATASSVALSSRYRSRCRPEQAAPGVDVADDHAGDVGVGDAHERERARLVCDDPDLDRIALWVGSAMHCLRSVARAPRGNASCERMLVRAAAPSYIGSTPYLGQTSFALPSSSPRWRWRRTTLSASRSSRNCGRACSRRGSARRPGSRRTCARPRTGSRCCATSAAPVMPTRSRRCSATTSRSAPETLVHDAGNPTEVMGDVVEYATAGRSESERDEIIRMLQETAHEWAVHNFRSGCEVADMLVRATRLRLRASARRWRSRSSAGTARASPPTWAARRSRSRCASCT